MACQKQAMVLTMATVRQIPKDKSHQVLSGSIKLVRILKSQNWQGKSIGMLRSKLSYKTLSVMETMERSGLAKMFRKRL